MRQRRRRCGRVLCALMLALGGGAMLASCAGDGSTLDPTGRPLDPPKVEVAPDTLRISLVEETSDSLFITVTNAGGFPLEITAVTSTSPLVTPRFDPPLTVLRNESIDITILVRAGVATGTPVAASVNITSNDSKAPIVMVPIRIDVTEAPEPEIDPTPTGIETTLIEGQADSLTIRISNLGSAPLEITQISSDSDAVTPLLVSGRIDPGGFLDVGIRLSAEDLAPGTLEATIVIASNDEDEPLVSIPITVEVESAGPFAATLSAIQENVFDKRCAVPGCHSGAASPVGLALDAGLSYGNLVDVASGEVIQFFRVEPGDAEHSYLIIKLVKEDFRRVGSRMPFVGFPYLLDEEIDVIRRWIDEGAKDN